MFHLLTAGVSLLTECRSLLRAIAVGALLFGALTPSPSYADSPALDFAELGSGFNYYQGQYSLGWRFTVNDEVTVTGLGFYDDRQNGLVSSHPVGIFDQQTCQLLASATVQPSDPLTGFFRYRAIAPVRLSAGRDYYIAALTTAPDAYAVGVSTLDIHPSISFWGFAIYGATEPTETLLCPNGSGASQNFKGDFGPSFLIGTGSGGGPVKRPTRVNLFCNRSGPQLETARCSATIADAGAPPRSLPTGSVDFVASGGFFPELASCFPTQTAFSPGIGSCEAVFQVPSGFPIGARFPIEAVYSGSDQFDSSATSHDLIQAGCVGDGNTPCSGAVSLGFANVPEIIQSVLDVVVGCGGTTAKASPLILPAAETKPSGKSSLCKVSVALNGDIAKALASLSATGITALGGVFDTLSQPKDPNALAVHELVHAVNAGDIDWSQMQEDPEAVEAALQALREKGILPPPTPRQAAPAGRSADAFAVPARQKKPFVFTLGSRRAGVKSDRQKTLRLKVPKGLAPTLQALKQVGVDEVDVSVSLKSTRKGKRPAGVERKVAAGETISVGIR